ncbi:MAG: TetR/AcrR family transcriptional regulator [Actinobacteria bacterium]|nr:TetR/AcrR family transcriptional regulator [Actinomycetota bacterium]
MSKSSAADGAWREARRLASRAEIVAAAWEAVREHGLAGLAIRDLARRAGITTPTVYAYFDSKNDIYDGMFGDAASEFVNWMSAPYDEDDPIAVLVEELRRFAAFCTADVPRYQLLFQRTIPGFEPSPSAYAIAEDALAALVRRLEALGIRGRRNLDLWTALCTGLVDQQISNDPRGERWTRLIDDAVTMFVGFCVTPDRRPSRGPRPPVRSGRRTK